MSGVRVSLKGISTALTMATSLLAASPACADYAYAYANAEAAFESESIDDRVRLQLLLAAAGYTNDVPMAEFSRHAYEGVQAFQRDNGFQPTGEVESDSAEVARLRRIGGEMLDFWGFTVIRHPSSQVRLWIPGNLGLSRHPNRDGYVYDDPAKRLGLQFMSFLNVDMQASYRASLKWFADQGAYVHYKVVKDDWYVVSASTPDGQDWYARYHRDGYATTGFTLAWNNANGMVHGKRVATLMSASLWADRTGAPMLTPWQLREGRPLLQPDVASRRVEAPPQPNPSEPVPVEKKGFSTGTGFFVDDVGDLLTNNHVIEDCSDISVRIPDKTIISATTTARDAANDLALLKVAGAAPKAARFGPTSNSARRSPYSAFRTPTSCPRPAALPRASCRPWPVCETTAATSRSPPPSRLGTQAGRSSTQTATRSTSWPSS